MVLRGHIENGAVILDDPIDLPESTAVLVTLPEAEGPTLVERLASCVGTAKDLPDDAAVNIDHYLYGAPRKP